MRKKIDDRQLAFVDEWWFQVVRHRDGKYKVYRTQCIRATHHVASWGNHWSYGFCCMTGLYPMTNLSAFNEDINKRFYKEEADAYISIMKREKLEKETGKTMVYYKEEEVNV